MTPTASRPESECFRAHQQERRRFIAVRLLVSARCEDSLPIAVPPFEKTGKLVNLAGIIGSVLLTISCIGCATIHGEKYTYKNLPREYAAVVKPNAQTVDFSRLASATTNSDLIDYGDVVEVLISAGLNEKDSIKMTVRVAEDGHAEIPEVGRIQLAGLEMTAAESAIGLECVHKGLFRNPSVTVLMKQQRTNRVLVTGAVKKPSIYHLPRGQCDLLSALSRAEGLDPTAGTEIVIRNVPNKSNGRADSVAGQRRNVIDPAGHSVELASSMSDTIKVDLISATKNGTGGYQLNDGAVVYVKKCDPEPLYVLGLVTRPGRYDYPVGKEVRVTDAVALAWGVSSLAANKVYVVRRKPLEPGQEVVDSENPVRPETFIIEVTLANAKQKTESNILLQPGDVVSVEQTPLTFFLYMINRFSIGSVVPLTGTPIL